MGKWRNQNKVFRRRSEFRPSRCFMICFKLDEIIPFSQVNMKHPPRNHVSIKRSFGTQLQGVLTIIFMVLAHNISILYISSFIYIYIYMQYKYTCIYACTPTSHTWCIVRMLCTYVSQTIYQIPFSKQKKNGATSCAALGDSAAAKLPSVSSETLGHEDMNDE